METTISKTTRIICLLQSGGDRVSIRSIQERAGLSRRSVYRYIESIARELPIRVDRGFVIIENVLRGGV
jgi:predicted DNA-binding transcriptional regulator YafY